MDCSKFEELIEPYIDGSLSSDDRLAFEEHLHICNSCSDSLEFSKSIRSTLHDLPLISVPHNFSVDLNKRLDKELAEEKRIHRGVFRIPSKYYGIAACILLAVSLNIDGMEFLHSTPDIEQPLVEDSEISDETSDITPTPYIQEIQPVIPSPSAESTAVAAPTPNQVKHTAVSTPIVKKSAPAKTSAAPTAAVNYPTVVSNASADNIVVPTPQAIKDAAKRDEINKVKEQIDNQAFTGRVIIASAIQDSCIIDEKSVDKMVDEVDYINSYSLLKEAAENKSIANVATLEKMKNVEVVNQNVIMYLQHDGTSSTGAVGNSVIVYKRDADKINSILHKYYTRECGEFYVISDTEYEEFLKELDENGINYTKSGDNKSSADDIMFKLVIA